MPVWFQPIEHESLADDELIMTSFKWNVHNHGRTMNLKWLAEIVHSNPAWLNPETAGEFGLADGDWIEITSYHSQMLQAAAPHLNRDGEVKGGRKVAGRIRVPVVIMAGIHPRVIAMSNSCGHWQYTAVAQARRTASRGEQLAGSDGATYRDPDWEQNMWWADDSGGDYRRWKKNTGNGWNQNQLLPIAPDPVTGQQAYHSTVVSIQKIS
jgi:anaerobic selenocysteine-containing dehydrogenase